VGSEGEEKRRWYPYARVGSEGEEEALFSGALSVETQFVPIWRRPCPGSSIWAHARYFLEILQLKRANLPPPTPPAVTVAD
jgi:hypothetical protein